VSWAVSPETLPGRTMPDSYLQLLIASKIFRAALGRTPVA
jgi:hypothetical protein